MVMLVLESQMRVEGITGRQITDFLLEATDDRYQAWWPGTHLHLHTLARGCHGDHVGERVLMDEFIGHRRVRMVGVVVQAVPGQRIVWQLRAGVRLPVRLSLDLATGAGGVDLRHTITAGWNGPGWLLDPLFRCYFTRGFAVAMDAHVHTEFPRLRDLLADTRTPGADTTATPPGMARTSSGRS
jgi:hypothetical protein